MKNLLHNDNLIVAEYRGDPVGFWVGFSDSNQLPISNQIDTLRVPAVGIVEDYHKKPVDLAPAEALSRQLKIWSLNSAKTVIFFEENTPSMNLNQKVYSPISRCCT